PQRLRPDRAGIPGPSRSLTAWRGLALLDDQSVQLGELGDAEPGALEGGCDLPTEGPVGAGDGESAVRQQAPGVFVADEGGAAEAVQADHIGGLLPDP